MIIQELTQAESIIPESIELPNKVSQSTMDTQVKKGAIASSALGQSYVEGKNELNLASASGNNEDLKHIIAQKDLLNRQSVATKQLNQELFHKSADEVATDMLRTAFMEQNNSAFESKYVDGLENSSTSQWKEFANKNRSIYDIKKNQIKTFEILHSEMIKLGKIEDAESWLKETFDFVNEITFQGFSDVLKSGTSASRLEELQHIAGIIQGMDDEDKPQAVKDLVASARAFQLVENPQDAIEDLERLSESFNKAGETATLTSTGIHDTLDFLFFVEGVKMFSGIGKQLSKIPEALSKRAEREAEVDMAAATRGATDDVSIASVQARAVAGEEAVAKDAVNGEFKFTQPENFQNESSMMSAPASAYGTSIAPNIAKEIDRNAQELGKAFTDFAVPQRLSQVVEEAQIKFSEEYLGRGVSHISHSPATGNIVMDYGTKANTPFKSRKVAENSIEKMGLADAKGVTDVSVIETSGGFNVRIRLNSPDLEGAYSHLSTVGRNLKNIEDVVPALTSLIHQSGDAGKGITTAIEKVVNNSLRPYFGKKGRKLKELISDMQSMSSRKTNPLTKEDYSTASPVWWSADEFAVNYYQKFGKAPTQGELKAFVGYRQLNDFAFELKAGELLKEVNARGERVFSLPSLTGDSAAYDFLGKQIDNSTLMTKSSNREGFVVLGETPSYFWKNSVRAENVGMLDNMNIIKLNPAHREDFVHLGIADEAVTYVAIPKTVPSRSAVTTDVSSYMAGGRIVDASPFFIKVGELVKGKSGGVTRLGDRTLFTASSRAEAKRGEKALRKLVELVVPAIRNKTVLEDSAIVEIGLGDVGIVSFEDAVQFIKSKRLLSDTMKIEGIEGRSLVSIGAANNLGALDRSMVSNSRRAQIFGKRTEGTRNILGTDSTKLDPLAATIDSLNITVDFASTLGMKERMLAYFNRNFKNDLVLSTNNPMDMLQAAVKSEVSVGKTNAIIAHQQFVLSQLRIPSKLESEYTLGVEKATNWVFGMKDNLFSRGGVSKADQQARLEGRQNIIDLFGRNPAEKIRTLAFHNFLGSFSIPSAIMQALNVTNIVAISPKFGLWAAKNSSTIAKAVLARDPEVTAIIAKQWKQMGFKSEQEVVDIVDYMMATGIGDIGASNILQSGMSGVQLVGTKMNTLKKMSTVFFDMGERFNQITARLTAVKEWQAANKAGITTREAKEWIAHRTHILTTGMSKSDLQLGLRGGVSSIVTQFWSYPMRLTAAMLPKKLGGSQVFTSAQKKRLAFMNAVLWGGAGLPLLDSLVDAVVDGSNLSPDEAKFLTNGVFDGLIFALSQGEIDTNLSHRAGNGQFYKDIYKTYTGDKSALEAVSGASGGFISQVYRGIGGLNNVIKSGMVQDVSQLSEVGLQFLASFNSGANNAMKLHLALNYGKVFSRNGAALFHINKPEAFLMALGIPPQGYEDIFTGFTDREEHKTLVKEYVTLYTKSIQSINRAGSDEERTNAIEGLKAVAIFAAEAGVDINSEAFSQAFDREDGGAMIDMFVDQHIEDQLLLDKTDPNGERMLQKDTKRREEQ